MSVKLAPEPKKASSVPGEMIASSIGLPLVVAASVGGVFLPSNWGLVLLLVTVPLALFLMHVIKTSSAKTMQARLNKKNEGNETRISHITQIENAYDVKFVSLSRSEVKVLPAQNVLALFNGYDEPFDGRLYVVDGEATLKINDKSGLVSASAVKSRLGQGDYYKAVKREEEKAARAQE